MASLGYRIFKRSFDVFLSFLAILIFSIPVTAIVFVAKLLTKDFSPMFYAQERYGKGGEVFKMVKYRTMVDERPTKVGKFLREHSIDEGPQVLNIFIGQMSFVGPRPYMVSERPSVERWFGEITKVRPGLSGPYQVLGRHSLTIEERAEMEAEYVKNVTLKGDMRLFGLACKAPFRAE